ncbi:hypothetical protein BX659_14510 [Orenia metallireducens]|uniref:Uncharacterized protein n=1 Tax=Orenia metallireducens TaxID=1413210 RepID=A0A285IFX6_9FIRM|nr:hypothetical protein [Orenia metallireducens]PRX18134.1 hypothetical protein BX659_14510 [Orenia metallireducens]SNY46900.1 hypothetical protein SAMN06265827_14610 [Orenia metallireducens]
MKKLTRKELMIIDGGFLAISYESVKGQTELSREEWNEQQRQAGIWYWNQYNKAIEILQQMNK